MSSRTRRSRLVVDLAGVTFLDSIAMRRLLEAAATTNARNVRVDFRRPSPVVERICELDPNADRTMNNW